MAGLSAILGAKRRTESKPKKVHPAAQKEFGPYELGVLAKVDYERGSKYDIFYKGGKAPGSAEFLAKHGVDNPQSKGGYEAGIDPGKRLLGKPDEEQGYLEGLLDEYDRWKKTGSRFPAIETDITRRKKYMRKRFTGNSQGFSGVLGGAATQKKTLLG